jgi:hypothetical protein
LCLAFASHCRLASWLLVGSSFTWCASSFHMSSTGSCTSLTTLHTNAALVQCLPLCSAPFQCFMQCLCPIPSSGFTASHDLDTAYSVSLCCVCSSLFTTTTLLII